MGFFDFAKPCVRCGEAPILNTTWLLTQCCDKKLCNPTCVAAWRAYLQQNRKCPYCNRSFDPTVGFLGR